MKEAEILRKNYEKLRKKYSLPGFEELNEDFEIEKIDNKDSLTLSREVRRKMIEKNLSYFKFLEMFLNPSSSPIFFHALISHMDSKSREKLEKLYFKLGKFELDSVGLDNNYSEDGDAKFIKNLFKEWQEIKNEFGEIINSLERVWEKEIEEKDRGYLG